MKRSYSFLNRAVRFIRPFSIVLFCLSCFPAFAGVMEGAGLGTYARQNIMLSSNRLLYPLGVEQAQSQTLAHDSEGATKASSGSGEKSIKEICEELLTEPVRAWTRKRNELKPVIKEALRQSMSPETGQQTWFNYLVLALVNHAVSESCEAVAAKHYLTKGSPFESEKTLRMLADSQPFTEVEATLPSSPDMKKTFQFRTWKASYSRPWESSLPDYILKFICEFSQERLTKQTALKLFGEVILPKNGELNELTEKSIEAIAEVYGHLEDIQQLQTSIPYLRAIYPDFVRYFENQE